VRAVIFDIGGVLLRWEPRLLYGRLIPDEAQRERFLSEICTLEWNGTLDAGRPFDEACEELATRHPEHRELIHAWKRQDEMIAGEVPGTATLVRRLRARSVPLLLLTNMPSDVFAARVERFPVLREFAGAVVSGEEGVLKPSAEIFAILAGRFGLDPSESLFIDDTAANVEGARAAGFHAHHFVGAEALEVELTAHRLL
jgi:HAD superfamily hydrolase (TIGR01509 family)